MPDKYAVSFAPDGKHFNIIKKGSRQKIWDYFTQDPHIRIQTHLNPKAKFVMYNMNTGEKIGELPRAKKKLKNLE